MKTVVSTLEFWHRMREPGFVRLSRLSGAIGSYHFVTLEAPEMKPGFIDSQLNVVRRTLGGEGE